MAGCRRPPGHFRQTAWDAREKTLGTTGAPTGGHRAPLVQGGLLRRQTDAVKGGGPGVLVGHAPQVPDRSTAEQVTVVSVATQHAAQSRPRRMMVGMSYPADRDAVAPAPWRGGLLLLREDVVQGGAGATPLLTRGLLRGGHGPSGGPEHRGLPRWSWWWWCWWVGGLWWWSVGGRDRRRGGVRWGWRAARCPC